MDYNRVILIGRLASEPELKVTPSGIPVTQFRLAVNRPISSEARQNGQEKADFFTIVAWRQSAEYAANYLGKGRLIMVEGRLQVREYQTADGQKRRDTEIVVDNLKSLDRPKEGAEGGGSNRYAEGDGYAQAAPRPTPAAAAPARRPAPAPASFGGEQDDSEIDDPFADN